MLVHHHPWQDDLIELIKLGVFHLNKDTAFDNRIAFLIFDVSVESIFKTFLTLPDEITKIKIKYQQRKEAIEGNFHNLARTVKEAAATVTETEITHIQYYHDQRNNLYHQGTGITISQQNAFKYGQLSISMLNKLLSVDVSGILIDNAEVKVEAQKVANRWQVVLDGFQDAVYKVVENIEPKLLLPSSQRRLRSISLNDSTRYSAQEENYQLFITEQIQDEKIKSWLLNLLESKSTSLAARNLETMMGWSKDPVYICLLIIGYSLTLDDDFDTTFLSPDEEIDMVEYIHDHIFGTYGSVKWHLQWLDTLTLPISSFGTFDEFVQKGDKICETLQSKQNVLIEWLQKNT